MFAYPSQWSAQIDNIPWAYIIALYVLTAIGLVWLLVIEPKSWVKIGEANGWSYYQHKRNPKKRRCQQCIMSQNKAWLRGETDTLEINPPK